MSSGKLIVLTGPSGVGKGTLVRSLLARHQNLYLSISATTRSPRGGEIDGQDYYFVSVPQFEEMITQENLLEWANYAGNYYGTPRQKVEEKIDQGITVLLEIELVGARKIQETFPTAIRIFILPPSVEELERRLRGRGTEAEEAIARRLERAKEELAASSEFNYTVVNDELEKALEALEELIVNR